MRQPGPFKMHVRAAPDCERGQPRKVGCRKRGEALLIAAICERLRLSLEQLQCTLHVCVDACALVHLFTMQGKRVAMGLAGVRTGSRVAGP